MGEASLSLRPRLPPSGYTYHHDDPVAADALARDLCRVAAFFTDVEPYVRLAHVRDWWEHDRLFFVEEAQFDLHHLFQMVGTPRELFRSMPGDDRVFVGILPTHERWYLRFHVDWSDDGQRIEGSYSLTFADELRKRFETDVLKSLSTVLQGESAESYFRRIG
jgi:hypothetical protein